MGSHHKLHYFFILLSSMALMLSSTAACAQEPNILGTYSGVVTETEFNCGTNFPGNPPLAPGSIDTDDLTLTISSQIGATFSWTGTKSADPGELFIIFFSGTVAPVGNVSGTFTSV